LRRGDRLAVNLDALCDLRHNHPLIVFLRL
jgi:hypothetical protein